MGLRTSTHLDVHDYESGIKRLTEGINKDQKSIGRYTKLRKARSGVLFVHYAGRDIVGLTPDGCVYFYIPASYTSYRSRINGFLDPMYLTVDSHQNKLWKDNGGWGKTPDFENVDTGVWYKIEPGEDQPVVEDPREIGSA